MSDAKCRVTVIMDVDERNDAKTAATKRGLDTMSGYIKWLIRKDQAALEAGK